MRKAEPALQAPRFRRGRWRERGRVRLPGAGGEPGERWLGPEAASGGGMGAVAAGEVHFDLFEGLALRFRHKEGGDEEISEGADGPEEEHRREYPGAHAGQKQTSKRRR